LTDSADGFSLCNTLCLFVSNALNRFLLLGLLLVLMSNKAFTNFLVHILNSAVGILEKAGYDVIGKVGGQWP